jgi:hypothetical protein
MLRKLRVMPRMSDTPRILLMSERNAESARWQAAQYEFEDVIADVDSVKLLAPFGSPATKSTRVINRAMRAAGRPQRFSDPVLRPVTVTGEHDLFFAVFYAAHDIPHLMQLKGWRERCDKAVCLIVELYSDEVTSYGPPYLSLLARFGFDQVFLFNPRPRNAVSRLVGCPADFLALGVDALRFSPYPGVPPRSIDF